MSAARKLDLAQAVACRGLGREAAARYIGIGPTKFDELVLAGVMPRPKSIGARRIWDRLALDTAFENLPSEGEGSGWEDV